MAYADLWLHLDLAEALVYDVLPAGLEEHLAGLPEVAEVNWVGNDTVGLEQVVGELPGHLLALVNYCKLV